MMKSDEKVNLDTRVSIVTPENVRFTHKLAGPWIRLFAFILDSIFLTLFLILIMIMLTITQKYLFQIQIFDGLYAIFSTLVLWFGTAIAETFFNGRTLGKLLCGLRVLTLDGQPITGMQAFTRNVIRTADIALGPLTFVLMSLNNRFMRLGDIAARTIVVQENERVNTKNFRFQHAGITRLIEAIPPDFVVSKSLKEALALYVQTRSRLAPSRNFEISKILGRTLIREAGLPENTNIDCFLCALYQWSSNGGTSNLK